MCFVHQIWFYFKFDNKNNFNFDNKIYYKSTNQLDGEIYYKSTNQLDGEIYYKFNVKIYFNLVSTNLLIY